MSDTTTVDNKTKDGAKRYTLDDTGLTRQEQQFVDRILSNLDNGFLFYKNPWDLNKLTPPCSAGTGKTYRGANRLLLTLTALENGFTDPRWITFNQMRKQKLFFKEGVPHHGSYVSFWERQDKLTKKIFDPESLKELSEEERAEYIEKNVHPMRKETLVYNADVIKGMKPLKDQPVEIAEVDKSDMLECILEHSEAKICLGTRACYYPTRDIIVMPPRECFDDISFYYSTALHEIGHSTGHKNRLNRDMKGSFGTKSYAKEELIAEFASAIMCVDFGLSPSTEHILTSAAYIQSWQRALSNTPALMREVLRSASASGKYVNQKMCEPFIAKKCLLDSAKIIEAKETDKQIASEQGLETSEHMNIVIDKNFFCIELKDGFKKSTAYHDIIEASKNMLVTLAATDNVYIVGKREQNESTADIFEQYEKGDLAATVISGLDTKAGLKILPVDKNAYNERFKNLNEISDADLKRYISHIEKVLSLPAKSKTKGKDEETVKVTQKEKSKGRGLEK